MSFVHLLLFITWGTVAPNLFNFGLWHLMGIYLRLVSMPFYHVLYNLSFFHRLLLLRDYQSLIKRFVYLNIVVEFWLKSHLGHLEKLLLHEVIGYRFRFVCFCRVVFVISRLNQRIVFIWHLFQLLNSPLLSLSLKLLLLPFAYQDLPDLLLHVVSWLHVTGVVDCRHRTFLGNLALLRVFRSFQIDLILQEGEGEKVLLIWKIAPSVSRYGFSIDRTGNGGADGMLHFIDLVHQREKIFRNTSNMQDGSLLYLHICLFTSWIYWTVLSFLITFIFPIFLSLNIFQFYYNWADDKLS